MIILITVATYPCRQLTKSITWQEYVTFLAANILWKAVTMELTFLCFLVACIVFTEILCCQPEFRASHAVVSVWAECGADEGRDRAMRSRCPQWHVCSVQHVDSGVVVAWWSKGKCDTAYRDYRRNGVPISEPDRTPVYALLLRVSWQRRHVCYW